MDFMMQHIKKKKKSAAKYFLCTNQNLIHSSMQHWDKNKLQGEKTIF